MESNAFCPVPRILEPPVPEDPFFRAGPEGWHLVSRGGKPVWEAPQQTVSGSNAENGWVRLQNGLMLQWGHGLGMGHGDTIWFNQTFPTACLNVSITDESVPSGTIHVMGVRQYSVTRSSFTLWMRPLDVNPNSPMYWFAIGI